MHKAPIQTNHVEESASFVEAVAATINTNDSSISQVYH